MQTTVDKQKNMLLKRYHFLLGKLGIDNDQKLEILAAYGVESGRDMDVKSLTDLCHRLDLMLNPALDEGDMWRKRVIASIGGWLTALGKDGRNIKTIKAIAARAAETDTFYAIPQEKLRSIYYAFRNKQKALAFVEKITAEEINSIISSN
jgi:hypothetical protein